jgi:hypothetical protein
VREVLDECERGKKDYGAAIIDYLYFKLQELRDKQKEDLAATEAQLAARKR